MTPGIIAFTVIYLILLCAYFVTAPSGKMYLRAPNKILMALMFFIFALVSWFTKGYSSSSYHTVLIVSLFMLMIGDIFLLVDFNRGGDFFLGGNVALAAYEICFLLDHGVSFKQFWWFLIPPFLIMCLYAFFFFKLTNIFKMKESYRIPFLFYLFSVTLHGSAGLAICIFCPQYALLGAGSMLFMMSDWEIMFDRFVFKSPWTLRLNALLYFVGLLLIVLSMQLCPLFK